MQFQQVIRYLLLLLLLSSVITGLYHISNGPMLINEKLSGPALKNHQLSDTEKPVWNVTYGSGDEERPNRIFEAQSGGYFVLYSENELGELNHPNTSLMRIDTNGNQIWNRMLHSSPFPLFTGGCNMIATQDGGYTISWTSANLTDFSFFVFLMHLDSECNQLWNNTMYLNSNEFVVQLLEHSSGGYFLLGSTEFSNVSHTFDIPMLIRTDASGNQIWNKTYEHFQHTSPVALVESSSGDLVIATTASNSGYYDIWIFSVDAGGNHKWNTTFDQRRNDLARDIELAANGGFLILGTTGMIISEDVILIKLDTFGDKLWNLTYDSTYTLTASDLQVFADGSLGILGGSDTDLGFHVPGFVHLDATGNILWNVTYEDEAYYKVETFVEVSPDVYVITASRHEAPDPPYPYDIWIAKIAKPMTITSASDQIHEISSMFNYDLNADSVLGLDTWTINDTVNFIIDEAGLIQNASVIPVGVYGLVATINDTGGRIRMTEFSVTVIDITGPTWYTVPADQISEYGSAFYYDVGALDPSGVSHYWLDDPSFKIDSSGVIVNDTILDLGNYPLTISVNDTYGNEVSIGITVSVQDATSPSPEDIQDIIFEVGDSGFWLIWSCSDNLPATYELQLNKAIIMSGPWDGSDIAFYVMGHELGVHNYTIIFRDSSGNFGHDTVLVNAVDTTNPYVNSPVDIWYLEGIAGNIIHWNATDLHPYSYTIYHDGVQIRTGGWGVDVVSIPVDDLLPGVHNFTIIIFDTSGNFVSDEVLVTVESTGVTTTPTTTTSTNQTDLQNKIDDLTSQVGALTIVLAIVGIVSAMSIVLVLFSIKRLAVNK